MYIWLLLKYIGDPELKLIIWIPLFVYCMDFIQGGGGSLLPYGLTYALVTYCYLKVWSVWNMIIKPTKTNF